MGELDMVLCFWQQMVAPRRNSIGNLKTTLRLTFQVNDCNDVKAEIYGKIGESTIPA